MTCATMSHLQHATGHNVAQNDIINHDIDLTQCNMPQKIDTDTLPPMTLQVISLKSFER